MLRHLGEKRESGVPRKGENDPADSVFVVLLAEEVPSYGGTLRSWQIGSIWCTLGEAEGAARRYVNEGHKAHHGWNFAVVMEYQTGQLAPDAERHGSEFYPPKPAPVTPEQAETEELAELELRIARLRAQKGQSQTVGAS